MEHRRIRIKRVKVESLPERGMPAVSGSELQLCGDHRVPS